MVNHEPSPAMMEIDFCTGLHRPVGTHQTHDLQKTLDSPFPRPYRAPVQCWQEARSEDKEYLFGGTSFIWGDSFNNPQLSEDASGKWRLWSETWPLMVTIPASVRDDGLKFKVQINMESYRTSQSQLSSMYHPIEIFRAQSHQKIVCTKGKPKLLHQLKQQPTTKSPIPSRSRDLR